MSTLKNSANTIIICVTAIACITIGSVAFLAFAIQDGARAASMIGLVLGFAGNAALGLTVLLRQDRNAQAVEVMAVKADEAAVKADVAAENTHALRNGEMEAKIRRVLIDVLKEKDTEVTST